MLMAYESSPNLSTKGLADKAAVSPRFVRQTLKKHGLAIPEEGLGTDGKSYSTSRATARLKKLKKALIAARPYLEGTALDSANEILKIMGETE